MFPPLAIRIVSPPSLPALPATEKAPLRGSITSIPHLQREGNWASARRACEIARPWAEDPASPAPEQANFFSTCGNVYPGSGELADPHAWTVDFRELQRRK